MSEHPTPPDSPRAIERPSAPRPSNDDKPVPYGQVSLEPMADPGSDWFNRPTPSAPRPSVPRPSLVDVPGMARPSPGGDQGPEPDSKHTYLGNMTAHDLRVMQEKALKYTERQMKRSGWLRTAANYLGVMFGASIASFFANRELLKASTEVKAEVRASMAPVEHKLDQALDGGLPGPGPVWGR